MAALQNIAIGIAVMVVAMACMVFGHWLASTKPQPDYWYCQNAKNPKRDQVAPTDRNATQDQKDTSITANERYHELCSQRRAADSAEDAAHVAWIQLWFGILGFGGLLANHRVQRSVCQSCQRRRCADDAA